MANPKLTLEQLRDYAAKHPNHEFSMHSNHNCLAAQCRGRSFDPGEFFGSQSGVPPAFVEYGRYTSAYVLGWKLAQDIQELIDQEKARGTTDTTPVAAVSGGSSEHGPPCGAD